MQFAPFPVQSGADNFASLQTYLTSRDRDQMILPLSTLEVMNDGSLDVGGDSMFMTKFAVKNLAGLCQIPPSYMLKSPDENAMQNFNFFLPSQKGNVQIITEVIDGKRSVVGLVKEKTTPIALEIVVEELEAAKHGMNLQKWWIDEQGLTARYISPAHAVEPRVGDIVNAGVDFMDYENSDGGLDVRGAMFRLVCTNGAVVPEISFGRHIKKADFKEPSVVMTTALGYFEETVRAVSSYTETLKDLTERSLELPEEDADKFLQRPLRVLRVPKKYHEHVADAMVPEEPSFFGLYNAVTRLGRDSAARDVKFIFERAGFRCVSLVEELQDAVDLAHSELS